MKAIAKHQIALDKHELDVYSFIGMRIPIPITMSETSEKTSSPSIVYDAIDVCSFVLEHAKQPVTHLKLHKMLYFIQGNYFKNSEEPLFHDDLSAWTYGPVVPDLYRQISVIIGKGNDEDLRGKFLIMKSNINNNSEVSEWLKSIITSLDAFTPTQLVEYSHAEGTPWDIIWKDGEGKFETISKKLLKLYFRD